jgi:hypothetical protein
MSHAVVQIYQLHQLPQPAHSPLYKCQRHQTCRSYNITIPNILNVSPASSPSSSSDVDDNGHCSPNPELTSFMSIDGDYDDEEMQNVTVVSFGIGVATAPPLDDDYIVTCDPLPPCVKGGVIGELRSPTPTEEEMCIICYDKIDKNDGNFYSNFCDTCKYTVHISCIEEYIIRKLKDDVQTHQTRFVGIKCLMCSKVVERGELTQEEFDEINNSDDRMVGDGITAEQRRDIRLHQHALRVMERQIRHDRRNGNKRVFCHVCFILCLILCAGGVLAAFITKTT